VMGSHVAVEAALAVDVEARGRHPVSLLIGAGDQTVRRDAQPDRMTKAGREYLRLCLLLAYPQETAARRQLGVARFEEVEVTLRVRFQAGVEGVLTGTGMPVITETLIDVGLAVAVNVPQPGQLPAFQHVNDPINHLQTERLIESHGEALPRQFFELVVDALDDPDIAVGGADDRITIGEKIDPTEEHQGVVRVIVGDSQRVDDEGSVVSAGLAARDDRLRPAGRPGFRPCPQAGWCWAGLEQSREARQVPGITLPEYHLAT